MKDILKVSAVAAVVSMAATGAIAESVTVDAETTVTETALQVSTYRTMNFGSFEIVSANASGTIEVDGGNVTANLTDAVYNGGSDAGGVRVEGTAGATVDVTCSTSATLAHESDSLDTMSVSNIAFQGTSCDQTISFTIASDGATNSNVNGTLTVNSPQGGAYSTANAGGTPITVDVVYQ